MSHRTATEHATRQTRAAIYTRVSTADQEQEGTSLDTQLDACGQFAMDRALVVDDAYVYREVYTGTELWQSPRLTQLRQAMRAHEIQVVVAYAIDRLSSDPVHLGVVLTEAEHAGVEVFFVTEPLDHSPEGQLIRFVRGYAAKVEHEKIKERTMRGRLARAKAGKLIPGWKPLYGYRFADDAKTRYEIDDVQASVVKRIFSETLQGMSRREIARRLTSERVPTPSARDFSWPVSTIGHMLANAHYTGRATAFCQRNPRGEKNRHQRGPSPESERIGLPEGTIPGIVDLATFAGVQERLERNKQASTRSARDPEGALLRAGIVRCGYCEQKLHVRHVSISGPRYICANYGFEGSCGEMPSISIPILDRAVWDQVQSVLTRPDVIAAEIERLRVEEPNSKELSGVDRALVEVGRRQRGLIEQLVGRQSSQKRRPSSTDARRGRLQTRASISLKPGAARLQPDSARSVIAKSVLP